MDSYTYTFMCWALKYSKYRARIVKLLTSPGIDSKESIFASLCSQAGRYNNPTILFQAPIECLKIPDQA